MTIHDKGPWRFVPPTESLTLAIQSADFTHDVVLYVTGDFADDAERAAYCEWLAATLNEAGKLRD